jgi:hypothetical protein
VFLLLFVFFYLPAAFRRESGRSVGPWWALAGFALAFASIPGIVSAYISGVALPQALVVGGLVASACAAVILLRAAFGASATALTFAIGCLTLFVLPGIEALCWSTGTKMAVPLGNLSLVSWLRRLAIVREVADPKAVVIAAGVLWLLVLVVVVKSSRALRAAAACVIMIPMLAGLGSGPPDATVTPLLGPVARAGARLPVAITIKGGSGVAEVALRTEALRVPADGQPHQALVTLLEGESEAELSAGGERLRVPLPFKWVEPGKPIVGTLAGGALGDPIRGALPSAEIVPIDLSSLPPVAGALEILDAIVVSSAEWPALRPEHRSLLRAYGALSGGLVLVGGTGADTREAGPRVRTIPSVADLGALELRRRFDPDPFDATLKGLFARPDWQALDLTRLVLFLLLYHGAFLVAFLLPLLLDSHKSSAVYLVSVGGVMIVVVAVAWWSVRQFFLRDNQVYTQSLTHVAVGAGDGDAVARQFRCYASMSGERRDFPWAADKDLVDYRDRGPARRVLDLGGPRRLDDVWLDRFHSKLLVREDMVLRSPVVIVAEGGGFRLRPVAEVPDPLGLRTATIARAVVVEADGGLRGATVDGSLIRVGELVDPTRASALDPVARALLGRFGGGGGRRLLVVRVAGVNRLDDTSGFFKTSDLESVLAFEI